VERLGRAAEALQDALCLSAPPAPGADPVIYLFHAWPREWDAGFSLLARGNFWVSSRMKAGKIPYVALKSMAGGTCRISNPWPERKPTLYVDGENRGSLKGKILRFDTAPGQKIVLVPSGPIPGGI
jgi:hypothetical protein